LEKTTRKKKKGHDNVKEVLYLEEGEKRNRTGNKEQEAEGVGLVHLR